MEDRWEEVRVWMGAAEGRRAVVVERPVEQEPAHNNISTEASFAKEAAEHIRQCDINKGRFWEERRLKQKRNISSKDKHFYPLPNLYLI